MHFIHLISDEGYIFFLSFLETTHIHLNIILTPMHSDLVNRIKQVVKSKQYRHRTIIYQSSVANIFYFFHLMNAKMTVICKAFFSARLHQSHLLQTCSYAYSFIQNDHATKSRNLGLPKSDTRISMPVVVLSPLSLGRKKKRRLSDRICRGHASSNDSTSDWHLRRIHVHIIVVADDGNVMEPSTTPPVPVHRLLTDDARL